MADSFTANPFAALNKKQFPAKSGTTSPSRSAQKKKKSSGHEDVDFLAAVGAAPCPPEDSRLFHEAMRNVRQEDGGKAGSKKSKGFALHEQQAFAPLHGQSKPEKAKPAPVSASLCPTSPQPEEALFAQAAAQEEEHGELSAFATAMRQVKPLAGKGREVAQIPEIVQPESTYTQEMLDSKLEFVLSPAGEHREGHVLGLDELTVNSLRAGAFSPEAHLDLHGLSAAQAFQALLGFIRGSWFKGLRTVLLVHGRGLNSPNGYGVLGDKVQHWLIQEPFKRVVLAFCTAVPADGGAGCVYVLLRKYKKKGQVYWERLPSDPDLS